MKLMSDPEMNFYFRPDVLVNCHVLASVTYTSVVLGQLRDMHMAHYVRTKSKTHAWAVELNLRLGQVKNLCLILK